ncbi:MAG: hypothetical protein Q9227_003858 [Pyrenula ochraceoflavens]
MDAGGLAQMTYNSHFNGLSAPNSGFGSRGKGSHIKRLSVALPPKISTIDETQPIDVGNTPRTSRGHLLAGLRTAPKSATLPPANSRLSFDGHVNNTSPAERTPQTTTSAFFPQNVQAANHAAQRQMYSLPEHILAPPQIEIDENAGDMDQEYYQQLMAANAMLAQQQRALQQQLLSITQASQQFSGLNLNNNGNQRYQTQVGNISSLYQQQMQQGLQPIVQPVPNNPGYYSVYSPMTGQQTIVMDNSVAQQDEAPTYQNIPKSASPPTPSFRAQVSPPPEEKPSSAHGLRSRSPPKPTPSPQRDEVEPLPPPSANAFRRGHKKSLSFISSLKNGSDVNKPTGPRSAGFPQTPMSGTFGPGHGREGKHPERQPRGPPPMEELIAKPTSKYEGSKNFTTRQRRNAIQNLVRAGAERRSELRHSGSGSASPGSDGEFNFSVSSGEGEDTVPTSGSLSGKPSIGSLRAVASGAIGSERKKSRERERNSVGSNGDCSTKSLSSDEGPFVGSQPVEVESSRRRTPMLVLSSAEKRKSAIM